MLLYLSQNDMAKVPHEQCTSLWRYLESASSKPKQLLMME
jgi:hypothetical protein